MATVLCISSHVARGFVGNRAAGFALERLGHEVWELATVHLSNHPGHPHAAGAPADPGVLTEMLDALETNGWLGQVDAVLSGYLPSAEHARVVADAVTRVRTAVPGALYLCDPACGDDPKGLYVSEPAARAIAETLLPLADITTPNRFELAWLAGADVADTATALQAAERLAPARVLATSIPAAAPDALSNLLCTPEGAWAATVTRQHTAPHGTGDFIAALFLAHRLAGRPDAEALALCTASVEAALQASASADELRLVDAQAAWADPAPWPVHALTADGRDDVPRYVAGVDGCRAGWVVVYRDVTGSRPPHVAQVAAFSEILETPEAPEIIAVDMPVGLPEQAGKGGRAAEQAVRPHLGDRKSSVFSVPARPAVMCTDYREACAVALAHSDPPRKVSRQSFALFPKIREIDELMTPELETRVYEVHPELGFWALNGNQAMSLPKKVKSKAHGPGLDQRRALLANHGFPRPFFEAELPSGVGPDDLVDAAVAAVTAERILNGQAEPFPAAPPRDAKGLRIAIWA